MVGAAELAYPYFDISQESSGLVDCGRLSIAGYGFPQTARRRRGGTPSPRTALCDVNQDVCNKCCAGCSGNGTCVEATGNSNQAGTCKSGSSNNNFLDGSGQASFCIRNFNDQVGPADEKFC